MTQPLSERTPEQALAHAEDWRNHLAANHRSGVVSPNGWLENDLVLLADKVRRLHVKDEVFSEMIKAMVRLGAQSDLLCIVCSFGDTMDDDEVLESLREWNNLRSAET